MDNNSQTPKTDSDVPKDCLLGLHSWIDRVGLLPPETQCDHCDETYGRPD